MSLKYEPSSGAPRDPPSDGLGDLRLHGEGRGVHAVHDPGAGPTSRLENNFVAEM